MRLCLTRLYYSSTLTGSENVLIALREREVPTTFARRKVQEGIGYKLQVKVVFSEVMKIAIFLTRISL